MEHGAMEFKRGSDLRTSTRVEPTNRVTCESCGDHAEADAAADHGWQLHPPVCPNCLRWTTAGTPGNHTITIRPRGKYWSVYEQGELLCVTVYRKGAAAVAARLRRDRPDAHHHGPR